MEKSININGKSLVYNLDYKKVKNINVRIKPDGKIYVSAPRFVTAPRIEEFLISKSGFLTKALSKFEKAKNVPKEALFSEKEIKQEILSFCQEVYPYFKDKCKDFPKIKFRRMTSRWGSCNAKSGIVTFNTNLMFAPRECFEYVVWHEFCHFVHQDHSKRFYDCLLKVCPDYKQRRKILAEIVLTKP